MSETFVGLPACKYCGTFAGGHIKLPYLRDHEEFCKMRPKTDIADKLKAVDEALKRSIEARQEAERLLEEVSKELGVDSRPWWKIW